MKLQKQFLLLLSVLFLFCCSCAALQQGNDYLHKKAVGFMNVYNQQYADYLDIITRDSFTEEQKEVLRIKKKLLTELFSAIKLFNYSIDIQGDTQLAEENVIKLINLRFLQLTEYLLEYQYYS